MSDELVGEVFIQRSRLGEVTFSLTAEAIALRGKRGFSKVELGVPLSDLSPHFERRTWRSPIMVGFPLLVSCATVAVAWVVVAPLLKFIVLMFAAGFFVTALRNLAPVTLVAVRDRAGLTVFEMVQDREPSAEFDRFVTNLRHAIIARRNW